MGRCPSIEKNAAQIGVKDRYIACTDMPCAADKWNGCALTGCQMMLKNSVEVKIC